MTENAIEDKCNYVICNKPRYMFIVSSFLEVVETSTFK